MRSRIYVDGRILAPEDAVVPVLDRGFLYGDSVYEVLWWHRGAPIQEDEHLDRLEESARRVYLELRATRAALSEAVARTVEAAAVGPDEDAYVRLMVTRGVGPLGLDLRRAARPSLVVIVAPAERPSAEDWERGLRVRIVGRRRTSSLALDPGAKTGNYLNSVLALHEAKRAGDDDAIMLNDRGEVTEGTTSNAYVVLDGAVVTPPLSAGILRGTTRTRVLDLCARHGIPAAERALVPEDVRRASEAFLSSSVRGVIPVTSMDGLPVGDGRPGPVTRRVRTLFEEAADRESALRRR